MYDRNLGQWQSKATLLFSLSAVVYSLSVPSCNPIGPFPYYYFKHQYYYCASICCIKCFSIIVLNCLLYPVRLGSNWFYFDFSENDIRVWLDLSKKLNNSTQNTRTRFIYEIGLWWGQDSVRVECQQEFCELFWVCGGYKASKLDQPSLVMSGLLRIKKP